MQDIPHSSGGVPRRRARPVRVPDSGDEVDVHAVLAAQQAAVTTRLEEGLHDIERRADRLMRQVGAEVFRAMQKARGDAPPLKDDAARSILTYVDERFQTLSMAVGRLEQAVQKLAQATGDVLLRTDQSRQAVDRVVASTSEDARRTKEALRQLATRIERSILPLAARLDAVEAAVKAATTRQRADLAGFTQRTSEGLLRVGQRLREGFAAMQEQADGRSRVMTEQIAASVAGELQRIESAIHQQASRSTAAAERVTQAAAESAARMQSSMDDLAARVDARLEDAVTETEALVNEAITRMARRQSKLLDAAITEAQQRREATVPEPAWEEAPPGPQEIDGLEGLEEVEDADAVEDEDEDEHPVVIPDLESDIRQLHAVIGELTEDEGEV